MRIVKNPKNIKRTQHDDVNDSPSMISTVEHKETSEYAKQIDATSL